VIKYFKERSKINYLYSSNNNGVAQFRTSEKVDTGPKNMEKHGKEWMEREERKLRGRSGDEHGKVGKARTYPQISEPGHAYE